MHEARKKIIDALREIEYSEIKEGYKHGQNIPVSTYQPWANHAEYLSLYSKIKGNTLVDNYRCWELYSIAKNLKDKEGDMFEVGVWRGGTAAIIGQFIGNGTLYLADTFEGVVNAGEKDSMYKGGEHADTSQGMVETLLSETGVKNYTILKGIFPKDTASMMKSDKIKLAHIDVDVYLSAKESFEYIWDKIIVGGAVVFDDYGFWGCEGVTELFNNFNYANGFKIHNLNGHGIIIKTH